MVLVFAETSNNKIKNSALEAVSYGRKVAEIVGTSCVALVLGTADDVGKLGQYGAGKVYQVTDDNLQHFDSQVYSSVIADAAKNLNAQLVIVNHSANGKSLLGRLGIKLNAGTVSGVNALPVLNNGVFEVGKGVFSGKALATVRINTPVKVMSLMGNAFKAKVIGDNQTVESLAIVVPAPKTQVLEVKTVEGTVPLPEASLVVSAGRGMKGPENWGIIEELAKTLGATTACSRPVADTEWRPHHEHVGQTGIAIRPNLYIAIGISGAIQHLAGVNNSKVIVVINKDPEAPFFKAADYGICADLFDVVPRLTAALKSFKLATV